MEIKLTHPKNELKTNIKIYDGKKIVFNRELNALGFTNAISPNNKYFAIELAASRDDDSNKTFLFDIEADTVLFSERIPFTFRKLLVDDSAKIYIDTEYGVYQVDKNGSLVDINKYYLCCLEKANADAIRYAAGYLKLHENTVSAAEVVIISMSKAIELQLDDFYGVSNTASALRYKGEAYEIIGDDEKALQSYVDAIYLDSKIGVKRRVNVLSKKLGLNQDELSPSETVKFLVIRNAKIREAAAEESRRGWEDFHKKGYIDAGTISINIKDSRNNNQPRFILLSIGVLFMPYIFFWFTLQRKYPNWYKIVCGLWLVFMVIILMADKNV